MKWNCKKLVAIFYKRRHVMQARHSWIPSWIPETHNSNLTECPKCPISFIKTCLMFFRYKVWFSDLPITWLLIKWLACHMASRSQLRVAAIMTSFIWHHPHHDINHSAFTKMADSQKYRQKYTRLSPSIYTFFGLICQKPLTCIRNNIVLQAYFNLKCNENCRKAAYHASSDSVQRVVSYAPCVCVYDVRLPNFAPFYPINNNGRH